MKKILLFMLVTLIGFTANAATVYFENTANWEQVYMYSWTDADNNGAWPGVQVTSTVTKDGKTYFRAETPYNMVIFNNGNGDQTKDCQTVDGMIYTSNGATGNLFGGGTAVIEDTVYLAGNFNNYSSSDAAYQFTKAANGNYTLTLASFSADSDFKVVYNGSWYGYTDSALAPGQTYTLGDTGMDNSKLEGDATNVTFTYNPTANTLKVDYSLGGSVVTPPTPGAHEVYLAGNFNDYTASDAAYQFTLGADGLYTLSLASFAADSNFKVICDGSWYGYTEGPVESGVEYALYDSFMDNSVLTGAATNLTFKYNADNNTLVVTYTTDGGTVVTPPTPGAHEVYLAGNFNDYTASDAAYQFTLGADGLYTLSLDSFAADAQFKVICDGNWWGYTEGPVESGVEYALYDSFMDNCVLTGAATNLTFKYNADNNTLVVTYTVGSTAVETLEAVEGEAEYFTLQGVKVANPANGIYVKVANGKADKVLVK